ncbi:MAG: ATP-binding protein [Elainellaceae cyanobacterium]
MSKQGPSPTYQPSQRSPASAALSSSSDDPAQSEQQLRPTCLDSEGVNWHAPDQLSDGNCSPSAAPIRLLLAEDDEDDYCLIQELLSEADEATFVLDWVTSFAGALEAIEHKTYDAYLVDYRLGPQDGLALMLQIQQRCCAPVIILSGQGDRELDVASLRLGASDYLDKTNLQSSLLEHYIRASIERNDAINALKESEQRYRQLFKQERTLRHQLNESNADLEQFALVASHDLREPLRAIAGHAQLLADEYGHVLDDTATEYMSFITDGVTRMQALIRDLLGFSRLQATPIDVSSKADCNQALQNALTNLQSAIVESNAVILCETLPTVSGDLTQITRLFQNLVDNAIKFRQPNVQPHVDVQVQGPVADARGKTEDLWTFSISDNGIGVEPQHADYIFKAFKRLHTQREVAGTGIGLAACQHIVQRHGGKIWLDPSQSEGATFCFTLRNPEQSAGVI